MNLNGENNIQTYDARKSLAELHYESGNIETAVKMYQELELNLEDGLGENNPYVVSVRDRRQEMERLS